jgi:hypothetical protein
MDGFRYAGRFIGVIFVGTAGLDCAETAGSGTYIAEDHKGGGTLTPAFAHIRTVATLTDRMELVVIYEFSDLTVVFSDREFDAEPIWFFGSGRRI